LNSRVPEEQNYPVVERKKQSTKDLIRRAQEAIRLNHQLQEEAKQALELIRIMMIRIRQDSGAKAQSLGQRRPFRA
jgi:hypothetical protein